MSYMVTNEQDLTKMFSSYFVNVASSLKEPIKNHLKSKVSTTTEFQISLINDTLVRNFQVLHILNVNKSIELDNIGPKRLKWSANSLTHWVNTPM